MRTSPSPRLRLRTRLLLALTTPAVVSLSVTGVFAQEPAPANPPAPMVLQTAPAPVLTLAECRQIALDGQPAVVAARNSLAAAEARARAVENILIPSLIQRDLPIRRKQSALGVQISRALLLQAEWEAVYSVTRNYLSAGYARQQLEVIDHTIANLKDFREAIDLLKEDPRRRDVTVRDVEKTDVLLQIAAGRREEAVIGYERALAALREAMGVGADDCPHLAPVLPDVHATVNKDEILALALARRGEIAQAVHAAEVVCLEIDAQATSLLPTMRTFASASDIHAQQVPQGERNGEYRPGALPLEMPPFLAGGKKGRVEQARALHEKTVAVVEKTRQLIILEATDNVLKWQEAARQTEELGKAADKAEAYQKSVRDDFRPESRTTPEQLLNAGLLATQSRVQANEANYHRLLALAALERITAGGFTAALEAAPPLATKPAENGNGSR